MPTAKLLRTLIKARSNTGAQRLLINGVPAVEGNHRSRMAYRGREAPACALHVSTEPRWTIGRRIFSFDVRHGDPHAPSCPIPPSFQSIIRYL
jgi:hypothetical protein